MGQADFAMRKRRRRVTKHCRELPPLIAAVDPAASLAVGRCKAGRQAMDALMLPAAVCSRAQGPGWCCRAARVALVGHSTLLLWAELSCQQLCWAPNRVSPSTTKCLRRQRSPAV